MKKVRLVIASVALLSLVSSSAVHADSYAPGEGLFLGAFVGHSAGHVASKVVAADDDPGADTTIDIKDGGIGLNGIEGGGYLGYGYKMGDLYAGFEWDYAAGGAEFEISSSKALVIVNNADASGKSGDLTKVTAETKWSTGGGGRIGYYMNADTLLTFKGGIGVSKFDVQWGTSKESYYAGGPRLGGALESRLSAIDPNLSLRMSWDYTDYLTVPVSGIGTEKSNGNNLDSEVTGAMYQARIGVQYSFFDVNSLF